MNIVIGTRRVMEGCRYGTSISATTITRKREREGRIGGDEGTGYVESSARSTDFTENGMEWNGIDKRLRHWKQDKSSQINIPRFLWQRNS